MDGQRLMTGQWFLKPQTHLDAERTSARPPQPPRRSSPHVEQYVWLMTASMAAVSGHGAGGMHARFMGLYRGGACAFELLDLPLYLSLTLCTL